MTGWQILGALILALPFAGFFWLSVVMNGWKAAAIIWAVTVVIVAGTYLGAMLVAGRIP